MPPFLELTARDARAALEALGVDAGTEPAVEARDGRTIVRLAGGRIAFFASSAEGLERLRRERHVLRLIDRHCGFRVPRVQRVSDDGCVDVREMVPGSLEPWAVYDMVRRDRALARPLGQAIGAILAEQHTRLPIAELRTFMPDRPEWPEPNAWILERLPRVVADDGLVGAARSLLERRDTLEPPAAPVLVHGDLGFHNLGMDGDPLTVRGVFDYDGAALADHQLDFRYLLFDMEGTELFDEARVVYEERTGRRVQLERVQLENAACALSFLAYRDGVPPEAGSCGRTLAQDLEWSRAALQRSGLAI